MRSLLTLLLLALTASAQTAPDACALSVKQSGRAFLDAGDAAYWGGAIADVSTSIGKRELGVFRQADGTFAPGPNLALKGGLWGALKVLEWKYPERRRTLLWFKVGIGVAFGVVAVHNARVGRAR